MTSRFNASSLFSLNALLLVALAAFTGARAYAAPFPAIELGSAESFAVLGASTITNVGPTVVTGDLGLSLGTSMTGFPPGLVTGGIYVSDTTALNARTDASTAFDQLASLGSAQDMLGANLGNRTLTAGIYSYADAATMNGVLTLDGNNLSDALFVFQIGSTLTTANASFNFINGASADNVWFQVGSSATLGMDTSFAGTIIARTSISLLTGVTVDGRLLALDGAVSLDSNTITAPTAIPEPATNALIVASLALVAVIGIRRRRR